MIWTWHSYVRPADSPKARWRWRSGTVEAATIEEAHLRAEHALHCYWHEGISVAKGEPHAADSGTL